MGYNDAIKNINLKNNMEKTFKELNELDTIIGNLYQTNPELKDGKFGYAYKRFSEKNFFPIFKDYREALTDVRIDNALTDEKTKAILTDPSRTSRGFQYSKEGLKAVIKAERAIDDLWMAKTVKIEPFFVKPEDMPADLGEEILALMKGVLVE